jgi:hypothetical protein
MAELALDYAAAGALVLPLHTPTSDGRCSCRGRGCEHPGKHPRTLNGKDDATNDPDSVRRWWDMWPEANIGVRPHPGHVVVDIDPRSGGTEQIRAMQDRHGRLPESRAAATGGGGWHYWTCHPGQVVGKLAPGVDVKSNAGYVVAPPSLHVSGHRYEWINSGPIAEPPPYLVGLLTRPPVQQRAATGRLTAKRMAGLVHLVATATPGQNRNSRLYWACARVHEARGDVAPLIAAAVANGLSPDEADKTARSAENAPPLRGGR